MATPIKTRVFIPAGSLSDNNGAEIRFHEFSLPPNEWQVLKLDLESRVLFSGFELQPLDTCGVVSIANIRLLHALSGETIWAAYPDFKEFTVTGAGQLVMNDDGLQMVCAEADARLCLPDLEDVPEVPLALEIWIRPDLDFQGLAQNWRFLYARLEEESQRSNNLQTRLNQGQQQVADFQNQVAKLNREIETRGQRNTTLQEKLEAQKQLAWRYFSELAAAEKLLEDQQHLKAESKSLTRTIKTLSKENKTLSKENKTLSKENKAFSKEIKTFSKENKTLSKENKTFSKEIKTLSKENKAFSKEIKTLSEENKTVQQGLQYLEKELRALRASARWKVGNTLIRGIEILLFRKQQPLAIERIFDKLKELRTKK